MRMWKARSVSAGPRLSLSVTRFIRATPPPTVADDYSACNCSVKRRTESAPGESAPVDGDRDLAGGVEGSLHPRAHVGHVVAGEVHPAVGLPQRGQRLVRRARLGSPRAAAPRHARPRDGERRLEFGRVLRVNPGTLFQRQTLAFSGRAFAHGSGEIQAVAHENPLAPAEAVRGIDDLADFLVGPRPAAVNLVVFFPEAAPELQSELGRAVVPGCSDGRLNRRREVLLNLGQYGQWNRGDAVVGIDASEPSTRIGICRPHPRSEERRVGKECRIRWASYE